MFELGDVIEMGDGWHETGAGEFTRKKVRSAARVLDTWINLGNPFSNFEYEEVSQQILAHMEGLV